jgi:hypothetical protein
LLALSDTIHHDTVDKEADQDQSSISSCDSDWPKVEESRYGVEHHRHDWLLVTRRDTKQGSGRGTRGRGGDLRGSARDNLGLEKSDVTTGTDL